MSNDSTGTPPPSPPAPQEPNYLQMLLDLVNNWRKEITETTASLHSISKLMDQITTCQRTIKMTMKEMAARQDQLIMRITELTNTWNGAWMRAQQGASPQPPEKKFMVVALLNWAMDSAQKKPVAFIMVLLAIIALAVTAAGLGWDLPRLFIK